MAGKKKTGDLSDAVVPVRLDRPVEAVLRAIAERSIYGERQISTIIRTIVTAWVLDAGERPVDAFDREFPRVQAARKKYEAGFAQESEQISREGNRAGRRRRKRAEAGSE